MHAMKREVVIYMENSSKVVTESEKAYRYGDGVSRKQKVQVSLAMLPAE